MCSACGSGPSLPRVIPGIELLTTSGEIMGLYVTEGIPRGLTVSEAIARIHSQGGLACLPHPYDLVRRGVIARGERESVAASVDMIEVLNGRSLAAIFNDKALALALRHGKPFTAGSDAHRAVEVGRAFVRGRGAPREGYFVGPAGHGPHRARVDALSVRSQLVVPGAIAPDQGLPQGFQALAPGAARHRRLLVFHGGT